MFKTVDIARHAAAIACTVVFSALCIFGAVAPAQQGAAPAQQIVRSIA